MEVVGIYIGTLTSIAINFQINHELYMSHLLNFAV